MTLRLFGYGILTTNLVCPFMFTDARITEIYEGTSEVQHLVIANDVIKEYKS